MTRKITTFEGAEAHAGTPAEKLERAAMTAMLFEDAHYEKGVTLAQRVAILANEVSQEDAERIARVSRNEYNLRHVPLWILTARMRAGNPVSAKAIEDVIQRADEPGEMLAQYWRDGKKPLPNQFKNALRNSVAKFDAYQLAKYDRRKDAVKIRDVLRLVHPTPKNAEQSENWRKLIAGELETPDTWETQLSSGADKKATFERLLKEGKLGYAALLKNLRGMREAGVDPALIKEAILARKGAGRVLPFRFVSAMKHAPQFEVELTKAMMASVKDMPRLKGKTAIVIDTSGSMDSSLGGKSEMRRMEAAAAMAAIAKGMCEDAVVFVTADKTVRVPDDVTPGAMLKKIRTNSFGAGWGGIYTTRMCDEVRRTGEYDRMIVVTDEQDCGGYRSSPTEAKPVGLKHNYMVNVAAYENGVAFPDKWVSISGFSESVFRFIEAHENASA